MAGPQATTLAANTKKDSRRSAYRGIACRGGSVASRTSPTTTKHYRNPGFSRPAKCRVRGRNRRNRQGEPHDDAQPRTAHAIAIAVHRISQRSRSDRRADCHLPRSPLRSVRDCFFFFFCIQAHRASKRPDPNSSQPTIPLPHAIGKSNPRSLANGRTSSATPSLRG